MAEYVRVSPFGSETPTLVSIGDIGVAQPLSLTLISGIAGPVGVTFASVIVVKVSDTHPTVRMVLTAVQTVAAEVCLTLT